MRRISDSGESEVFSVLVSGGVAAVFAVVFSVVFSVTAMLQPPNTTSNRIKLAFLIGLFSPSSPAIQSGPFARLNEGRPIERMLQIFALQHPQLYLSQPLTSLQPLLKRLTVMDHQVLRLGVPHRPEAHDLTLGPGQRQRAP